MLTENDTENVDPIKAFETEKQILKYNGFYRNSQTKITIYNFPFIILSWSCCLLMWLPMAIEMCRKIGEVDQLIQVSYFFMTQTGYLCKLINFHWTQHLLEPLEEILRGEIFKNHTKSQDKFIEDGIASAKYLGLVFRILCGVTILFCAIYPYVDTNLDYPMPIAGWYPFNVTDYRTALTFYQITTLGLSAFCNASLDLLTCSLIILGSAQFEILKDKLSKVCSGKDMAEEGVLEELRECVLHHNEIIRYVSLVERLFTMGILVQFVASAIVICMTGFQLTVSPPKSIRFLLLMVYLFAMLNQLIMYCWFGHDIMFKSNRIMDSCYESNWFEYGKSARKTLFIIMERSKRPATVTAGKIFTLSLGTLATILRSSYSYFAVLQRVYNE